MFFVSRPCEGQCFTCPYPDCVRTPLEILAMEAKQTRPSRKGYHHSKQKRMNTDITAAEIRKARGDMTQRQFAEVTGLPKSVISAWELGKTHPSDENYAILKKYLEGL